MAEVVHLESRRKPVRYSVDIEQHANGKVAVFLEGIRDSRHNRRKVSQVLRHAADLLADEESYP
jgi:hypothetical protein